MEIKMDHWAILIIWNGKDILFLIEDVYVHTIKVIDCLAWIGFLVWDWKMKIVNFMEILTTILLFVHSLMNQMYLR